MPRYTGKTCRLLAMLFLTSSFFLVEIIVGYVTNSIALVADSFHMLSDVVALIVGFASIRISRWPARSNTFGWVRAEILGALFNAIFLLALCFSILVESLQRLVKVEEIEQPVLLLAVGAAGLVVNLIGLFLFHGQVHGHSHGGHGKEGHSHGKSIEGEKTAADEIQSLVQQGGGESAAHSAVPSQTETRVGIAEKSHQKKASTSSQMNMKGVFLHVLGDALGSVVVIISALVIWLAEGEWRFYVDPAMSILMVILILSTTVPLLKQTSLILLQTAPGHIDHDILKTKLEQMDGVLGVHEFHLWQLTTNRIILSAHITCLNLNEYMDIAARVKKFFHQEGVHATTIQPEFIDPQSRNVETCTLICANDCLKDSCCEPSKSSNRSKTQVSEPIIPSSNPAIYLNDTNIELQPHANLPRPPVEITVDPEVL